jgi:hypothetical protein
MTQSRTNNQKQEDAKGEPRSDSIFGLKNTRCEFNNAEHSSQDSPAQLNLRGLV